MAPETQEKFKIASELFSLPGYPSPIAEVTIAGRKVYLKRDDKLFLKCSKQRSIPLMLNEYLKKGLQKFVVSSSGNSGLVATHCALKSNTNFELIVYLSSYISESKLNYFFNSLGILDHKNDFRTNKTLVLKKVTFFLSDNPKQAAFAKAQSGYVNLRGSTDDLAIEGFESISSELVEQIGEDIDSIYVPASSGTTAVGIFEGFKNLNLFPAINVVQTTKINALVKNVAEHKEIEPDHPSESIVDLVGHRREQIEKIIETSKGKGWIISSEELNNAKIESEKVGIELSNDSLLGVAAFLSSKDSKKPVIICTG